MVLHKYARRQRDAAAGVGNIAPNARVTGLSFLPH